MHGVRLLGKAGESLALDLTGYPFPGVIDLRGPTCWHVVSGSAVVDEKPWNFCYPALTCDESARIPGWLREVADLAASGAATMGWADANLGMVFAQPCLSLRAFPPPVAGGRFTLVVGLGHEFAPPWHSNPGRRDAVTIGLDVDDSQLRIAAAEWDAHLALFPPMPTPSAIATT
jgi:hypothetical protein